jgi:hypothetical protein
MPAMEDESTALGNNSTTISAPDVIGIIESEDFSGRHDSINKDVEGVNGGEDAYVVESGNEVNRNSSSESKKRSSENEYDDDDEPLPTLPLKRARTAYFIFADEKRDEVKQQV